MPGQGWICLEGVCEYSATDGVYKTKAECEAARIALPPPFTGGQCLDILYRIEFSFTDGLGARQFIEQDAAGAILGVYSEPGSFGNTSLGYETKGSDGVTRRFLQTGTTDPGGGSPAVRILFRLDGQSDNCGDPPPKYECGPPPDPNDPDPDPGGGGGGGDPDPNKNPVIELDPNTVTWVCSPLEITCAGLEDTVNNLPSPKTIGNLSGCSTEDYQGDTTVPAACDTDAPNQIFLFEVRNKITNELIDSRVNCCCPTVVPIESGNNIPGFVCSCPDWGKATSYNQTLFSSSIGLREWIVSEAGAKTDCKHIMAAKRIMGVEQPIYTDPPYSAPPAPRTPG